MIYKLRAIPLAVQNDGLVRSNEALAEWMRNDKTMPFGERGEHTTVRLIDFDDSENNELIVCNQWTYKVGQLEKRFDIVLLINGLPVVIGEAKTPVRPAVTWVDGASQIHDDYEQSIPAMFVPNIFSFASDGRAYRYGSKPERCRSLGLPTKSSMGGLPWAPVPSNRQAHASHKSSVLHFSFGGEFDPVTRRYTTSELVNAASAADLGVTDVSIQVIGDMGIDAVLFWAAKANVRRGFPDDKRPVCSRGSAE